MSAAAQDRCQLTPMEIPVRIIGHRPIAMLTLNGTEVPMLVDSGAFYSMLSASTAEQLKLSLRSLPPGLVITGHTGRVEAKRTVVEKVKLLNAELSNVEFIVGGNDLDSGIMGVLGRNILAAADTEYDLAHGVVRLIFPKGDCEKVNFAYWADSAPVIAAPLDRSSRKSDSQISVEISLNGKRTLALLDTGAPQTVLLLKAARRAGIEEKDLKPYGRASGVGTGSVQSWTARVDTFELGGEKITQNTFRIDDTDKLEYDMLLGLDYFLSHRIYVSRLQRKLYATWNGGPVFALGRPANARYDASDAAVPKDIAQDDADALARRGAAAIAAKNYPLALEDLNRACELKPDVADYFFSRARLHLEMGQPALALADLDRALYLDPALALARILRAWVRTSQNELPGAREDLVQLDTTLPTSSNLRTDMASLHVRLNQISEALRQYDLWVGSHKIDARLANVLNSRCWLRTRLNMDLSLALQDCKDSIDADGNSSHSHDSLGWTWLRLNDAAKAKKAFDSAIKLETGPLSLYGRAIAQTRLGEVDNAERDVAAARKLNPKIDDEVRKAGFEFALPQVP